MSYQLYRNTTLGHTLQESLDELIQYNQIPVALANKVLLQFDKSMNHSLANKVKSRLTFKAGKLHTYRFCDNVWTFLLNDVEFREVQELTKVDKARKPHTVSLDTLSWSIQVVIYTLLLHSQVKIVACDGKNPSGAAVMGIQDV